MRSKTPSKFLPILFAACLAAGCAGAPRAATPVAVKADDPASFWENLPKAKTVSRADAVFNVGRAAMFVAACANGEVAALRAATEDRLHQQLRLEQVPDSAAALDAALEAGAWAAWLSGSGPTIAAVCDPGRAEEIAGALPASGHVKLLRIDHEGVVALGAGVDDDVVGVDAQG